MQPPAPPPALSRTHAAPVPPLVCTGNHIILPCSVTIVEYNSKKIYHTYQKQKKERKKQDRTCQNEKTLTYPYGFTVYPQCFVDTTVLWVWFSTRTRTGMGFVGTGLGWTLPTHARPMCHPNELDMLPSDEREDIFKQTSDISDAVTKVCPFFYLATNLLVNFLRSVIWHLQSPT